MVLSVNFALALLNWLWAFDTAELPGRPPIRHSRSAMIGELWEWFEVLRSGNKSTAWHTVYATIVNFHSDHSRIVGNLTLPIYGRVARTRAQSLRAPMIGSKLSHFCMKATTRLIGRG